MPFEKNDLLNIDFFQENNELFKQHGENIIKCTDTVKRMNLSDQFVERGTVCENPQILPNSTKNYLSYNIYDWMYHHKIDYKETNKPTEYDFPIKLSGYINRLKEIRGRLVCKECRNLLIPNYKYAINSKLNVRFTKKDEKWHLETKSRIGAFYRCTIFECKNHTCNLQNNHIYINHCNGANCGKIIDSRDITNKCTNGWNICNNCYSCCKQPYINRKQTELLRGNELNALIKKHYHGSCPKCSSYLKLFSKVNKRGKKELFIYCRKNKTKDCDFKVSNGYIHKRYYKLKSIFLRNGPFRSNLKIPC